MNHCTSGRLAACFGLAATLAIAACGVDEEPGAADTTSAAVVGETISPTEPTTVSLADSPQGPDDVDIDDVVLTVATGVVTQRVGGLAEASGSYADAPYEIEWVNFPSGVDQLQAVAAGNVDIAIGMGDSAVPNAAGSAPEPWTVDSRPVRILGWSCPPPGAAPSSVLFARGGSGITSVEQLAGRTVTFTTGGWQELLVHQALGEHDLTIEDVDVALLDFASGLNAFLTGSVDAVALPNVAIQQAEEAGGVVLATNFDVPSLPTCLPAVANDAALDDPAKKAAIADFIGRLAISQNWLADPANTDQVLTLCQSPPIDQPLANCQSFADSTKPIAYPGNADTIAVQQAMTDALFDVGIISREVDLDTVYDGFADNQILANLHPALAPDSAPAIGANS